MRFNLHTYLYICVHNVYACISKARTYDHIPILFIVYIFIYIYYAFHISVYIYNFNCIICIPIYNIIYLHLYIYMFNSEYTMKENIYYRYIYIYTYIYIFIYLIYLSYLVVGARLIDGHGVLCHFGVFLASPALCGWGGWGGWEVGWQ